VAERADILRLLPKGGTVAEVGVAFGTYTRAMIDSMQPSHFVAIDTFDLDEPGWFGRQAYRKELGGLSHEARYRENFATEIAAGMLEVKKGFSYEVMEGFADQYFDMIYIDAAHDYDSVRRDLAVCSRKIKDDGFLVLNDYTVVNPLLLTPYGIVQATNEFCVEQGWEIVYLALHRHMICDVALRKIR
jgi:hypothetical protein